MLSATKPHPKTLTDADIKYLKDLLDKAARLSFERIWTEVSGKEWHDTEVSQPPKNDVSFYKDWPGEEVAQNTTH